MINATKSEISSRMEMKRLNFICGYRCCCCYYYILMLLMLNDGHSRKCLLKGYWACLESLFGLWNYLISLSITKMGAIVDMYFL